MTSFKNKTALTLIGTTIMIATVGFVCGVLGTYIGAISMKASVFGFGSFAGGFFGLVVGYAFGVMAGAILLNKVFHRQGSLMLGLAGIIIGTFLAAVLPVLLHLNMGINLMLGIFFFIVALLCVLGFCLKEKRL